MASTGLSEFKAVLSDFSQLSSLAVKGVIIVPLADIWLKFGPPPPKLIAGLTSLMEFLAIVFVFQFWSQISDRKLKLRMKGALGLVILGMIGSYVLLNSLTVAPGQGQERIFKGLTLRSDVKPIITGSYTAEQALRESEYNSQKVWTQDSVVIARTIITVIWVATFVCLAIYLTVFIILQRRQSGQLS